MSGALGVLVAAAIYVAVVAAIGLAAARRSSSSPSEYFLAGRGLSTLVLFMALFGTNATSFVLVGVPGWAYHDGVGIFSANAPIIALGIPLSFWAIGSPARRMAARLDALTPVELYARRFGSRWLGVVLFLAFGAYTVPYMVQAVSASGTVLESASDGAIPHALGAAGVVAVALFYTSLGGMRGTAWTNVFQGAVLLVFTLGAFVLVARSMGGLGAAVEAVRAHDPDLLRLARGRFAAPGAFASWSLVISLTVIAFPHMLARLMAARDQRALRDVCRLYPLALALLWLPAVMIGVLGAAAFPGLEGRESDEILTLVSREHLPPAFAALGFLAVLAAVMSTLDAQILTLSSMLVRDVVERERGVESDAGAVRLGRLFALGVAALVLGLSQVWTESVGDISRRAFEGYVTLVPALFCGVRWRRFNPAGAVASLAVGNGVLAVGWAQGAGAWLGFTPVFWAFLGGCAAAVVATLATPPPEAERTRAAFGPEEPPRG